MADNITKEELAKKRDYSGEIDLKNLLMATVLEARGEGEEGMFAVARSIHNRKDLITKGKVLPSTFMPNSKNKNPTYTDLITHKNQYQVYDRERKGFKAQKSPITQNDIDVGKRAMFIALNDDAAFKYVQDKGLDPRTYYAVNFRRVDAKKDASQQKQKFVIGNHEFNLSGSPFAEQFENK